MNGSTASLIEVTVDVSVLQLEKEKFIMYSAHSLFSPIVLAG